MFRLSQLILKGRLKGSSLNNQYRNVALSYKLYGNDLGSRAPILIIHGLLGSKRHWMGLGKTINNISARSVVVVDARNHGDSPHVNSHQYEDLVGDTIELMNKLSIQSSVLIGHSMGGRAAMATALMHPKRVAGLLVVDISPISTHGTLNRGVRDVMNAMQSIKITGQNVRAARDSARKQLLAVIKDEKTLRTILNNINVRPDKTIGWTVNLKTLVVYFEKIATFPQHLLRKTYDGPTFFIGGALSDYLPPDDLNRIRGIFPKAVITYIKDTGHMLHYEDPKSFLEHTFRFLKLCP